LDPLKISLCELNGWIWIAKVAPFWAELFSLDRILKEYSQCEFKTWMDPDSQCVSLRYGIL
jgi:hypothetical protein